MLGQEPLGLERRHATHAGGGNGLAVHAVAHVAGGEHAGHAGRGAVGGGGDIAAGVDLELALEQLGRRVVADGDEHAVDGERARLAALEVAQPRAGDAGWVFRSDDLVDHAVPRDLDLVLAEQAVLQHLVGAQPVAAVNQRHLGRELGEEERLLGRRVAAADDRHLLAPEEEAIASGARRNAKALVAVLAREAEPARHGAGTDDEGIAGVDVAAVAIAAERPPAEVGLDDGVGEHPHTDASRLFLHLLHQPRPLDHVGVAGVVLDIGGDRHLAARLQPLHDDRLGVGPRGVDRGGVAGRPGTDDQDLGVMRLGHGGAPDEVGTVELYIEITPRRRKPRRGPDIIQNPNMWSKLKTPFRPTRPW